MQDAAPTSQRLSPRASAAVARILAAGLLAALVGGCGDDDAGDGAGRFGVCGEGCDLGKTCDPTLGCVECLGDADCGALVCIRGKCEDCRTSEQCPTGQSCFPRDHKCEAPCESDADCDKKEEMCDVTSGACVACVTGDECGGGEPLCDVEFGQCVQCVDDADCGSQYCDAKDSKCAECIVDAHCPAIRPSCDGKECRAVCTSDADCDGDKPACSIDHGHCHECTADVHCGGDTPLCKDDKECVACIADVDCGDGYCKDDECVECREDTDCADPALPACDDGICAAG